jgi:hypothetical protein
MADFYESLTDAQIDFIKQQHMFCNASAHSTGRVNLSPKGMDTFRVIDNRTVAYLDMLGSGNETCAHIQNDGRVTLMFCSYEQKPLILRIYGKGEVVGPSDQKWDDLVEHFDEIHGQRQIILIHVESTQDSCGFGVPRYEFKGERETLKKFATKFTDEQTAGYIASQTESIDGLPICPSV